MTLQNITVVADVPEDQTTAAQAAAATFVSELPGNVTGAVVVSATFGGTSLLPSPAERFQSARDAFDTLASQNSIKPADLKAALAELDDATAAYELSLLPAAQPATPPAVYSPPPVPSAPVTVDPATVAAQAPAPIGEEPADAPAAVTDAPAPTGDAPAAS